MSERKNGSFWKYGVIAVSVIAMVCLPARSAIFWDISFAQEAEEDLSENIISESTTWSGSRIVTDEIIVERGATLTVSKGTVLEFDEFGSLTVLGALRVEGTVDDPVIIRKHESENESSYSIVARDSGTIRIRNADISGGGSAVNAVPIGFRDYPRWIMAAEAAWFYTGAVGAVGGGSLDIEGANFHNNGLAVFVEALSSSRTAKIWRSKFPENDFDIVERRGSGTVDARYNWWDRESGPAPCSTVEDEEEEPACVGGVYQKVLGRVNVADWAREEFFKDPVLVLPGILGSWRWSEGSELELDPIFGSFDDLIETLDTNGYTRDENLFPFPYEWHESNVESARLLKEKIESILAERKWPRVDIVAYSMGGLVAREYIEALGGGEKVDQLVTLGTPQTGSPKSYFMWEGGEFLSNRKISISDILAKKIFTHEAKENNYENVFDYIRYAPIPAVRELLPVYSYLRDKDSGDLRAYPDLTPRNLFLERLNSEALLKKLEPVSFTAIVGKAGDKETIETIRVEEPTIQIMNDPESIIRWGYGEPDGYESLLGDRGLELGEGDGTVPRESARSIPADEIVEIESKHGDLPSKSAAQIVRILRGVDPVLEIVPGVPTEKLFVVLVFSPVDIQVVSPSGKRIGKNFETSGTYREIPGAYYTGFDTKSEFLTIRNPEPGTYTILTQGTGSGDYHVEASLIREDENRDGKESTVSFTGNATPGETSRSTVRLTEAGEVIQEEIDETPPTVTLASPESKTYQNAGSIEISFTGTDETTASDTVAYEVLLDESGYAGESIDLSLLSLGAHTFRVRAIDEAGNVGEASVNFTLETSWESQLKNIEHFRELGFFKHEWSTKTIEGNTRLLLLGEKILREHHALFEWYPSLKMVLLRSLNYRADVLEIFIESQRGTEIDTRATDRLLENMEFLRSRW